MSGPTTPPPVPAQSSRLRRAAGLLCLAAILVGCLAHLTFRDHYRFPLSGLFYALPRPLLLALAVFGGVLARRIGPRVLWGMMIFALAVWVSQADVAWNRSAETASDVEQVVFWNVGHDLPDDVAVVDRFLQQKPAMLGLVETGELTEEWVDAWRKQHPDYDIITAHRGLLLAVRGKIVDHRPLGLARNSHALQAHAEIDGQPVRIFVVDIAANPWIPRRDAMIKLAELLQTGGDKPIVVMGDFNAPDDSVWFAPLKQNFREVFRTAGHGYVPTWPWPAPILKLDHIWVNYRVEVLRAWQQYSWHSDHRAQWAKIRRNRAN